MIENLLNETFVYDEIQELEDKNKYLLKKIESFKKGIKDLLENLKEINFELKSKDESIGRLLNLENLLIEDYNQYENIENLLNETFVYDEIQELEDKNKYLLKKIESFKKGIKDLLKNWKQANYDLGMKNQLTELFEKLENLLPLSSIENLKQENHQLNKKLALKKKEIEEQLEDNEKHEQKNIELNKNNEILSKKNKDLTVKLNVITQENKIFSSDNKDITHKLTLSQQQLAIVTQEKNKLIKKQQDLIDEIKEFNNLNNQVEPLKTKLQQSETNQLRLTEQLNELTKEKEKTQIQLNTITQEKDKLIKKQQDLTDEIAELNNQVDLLNKKLQQSETNQLRLTEQLNELTKEKEKTQIQLNTITQEKDKLIKKQQDLTDEIAELNNQVDLLNKKLQQSETNQLRLTEQLNELTKEKEKTQIQLNTITQEKETLNREKQNLINENQTEKQKNKQEVKELENKQDLLNKKLQQSETNQLRLQQQLATVTQERDKLIKEQQDLTDKIKESILIKNSDYYQKINYISDPVIITKHKYNNWNIETLPNIKNEKIKKTILLNIEENKILNNLIEQKINITIIFCKKTKKFKEAFFIDKYQNKKIINVENHHQTILEKLNYKIRTEMANSLTKSDINKINNFNNQKQPTKSPCLTQEELKKYQNQGAVPKHYKLV